MAEAKNPEPTKQVQVTAKVPTAAERETPQTETKPPEVQANSQEEKKEEKPVEKPKGLRFHITRPSRNRYIKMFAYGKYGAGKTRFWSTAADVDSMSDVIGIDAEAGTMSIDDRGDKIDIVPVQTYDQIDSIYEFLRLHCRYRDEGNEEGLIRLEKKLKRIDLLDLPENDERRTGLTAEDYADIDFAKERLEREGPRHYKTVALDSLAEMYKYIMYQLLGVTTQQKMSAAMANPEWGEYGAAAEMVKLLCRRFRDLPMNVVIVCPAKEEVTDKKVIYYRPALSGKLAADVQGFMDVVGFIMSKLAKDDEGDEKVIRRMYLQPTPLFDAKDRYHKLNSVKYIDDPSFESFLQD